MPRALFEKTGNAVYISHLDLMRLFQRAFKRAGLSLTHTQGYSPKPSVSIALPLSLGVESRCELLDFDLDGEPVSCDEIQQRLNEVLVDGVRVLSVYDRGDKIKNLALLDCSIWFEYDHGIPVDGEDKITALFSQESLVMEKRNRNGVSRSNIIPMLRSFVLHREDGNTLRIDARVCCQNPSLNPMQLAAAIEQYLPECRPDFAHCCRMEIYDANENVFR